METNASDFTMGIVLSQEEEEKRLHLVAFYSRKFSAAKINYEIHDNELLAIMVSFQEWRHSLEGASHHVTIYTDYKNLEYLMTARVLNCRQAYWNMSLSQFDFVITYRPKKQQGLFNALFSRSYLVPREGEVAYEQQQTTLLKAEQLHLHGATTPSRSNHVNSDGFIIS
jgi:hypothetical protein